MRLDPFKLERYFSRYEFGVRHTLCASDCESMSVADLLTVEPGSADGLARCWLGYTESEGSPALREEISRTYSGIKPGQILVHNGAEEAIFLFMNAVLKRGDHVVVHWPCYQSFFAVAEGIGCEVTFWKARPENGWALDLTSSCGSSGRTPAPSSSTCRITPRVI